MTEHDEGRKTRPPAAGPATEFLLEEQKQRRTELDSVIGRMESDQRNGLLFTGAVWAWLITNQQMVTGRANLIAAALPALVIAFFYYRYTGLLEFTGTIADYTRLLEQKFQLPEGLGWEKYVYELRRTGKWPRSLGKRAKLLWASLLLLNAIIGVLYYFR